MKGQTRVSGVSTLRLMPIVRVCVLCLSLSLYVVCVCVGMNPTEVALENGIRKVSVVQVSEACVVFFVLFLSSF